MDPRINEQYTRRTALNVAVATFDSLSMAARIGMSGMGDPARKVAEGVRQLRVETLGHFIEAGDCHTPCPELLMKLDAFMEQLQDELDVIADDAEAHGDHDNGK